MGGATVVIADDQAISRRGLRLVASEVPGLDTEEIDSLDALLGRLRRGDVTLLVLSGSFARDLTALRRMKANFPNVSMLVVNSHSDDIAAMHALRAGASGYLDNTSSVEDFLNAIRRLQGGGTFLTRAVAENIATEMARGTPGSMLHERLSPRELEVFQLLGAGKTVGEIAEKLRLSVKTVSTHRARILEKTGLRNNADIIRYAMLNNLV